MALTGKQRNFINAYLTTFNATEAARQAKYRGNDATLASVGWENLRKPEIAEAIQKRLQEKAMTADEVLNRLADQGRASMSDFVRFDEEGNPRLDLKNAANLGKLHLAKKLKTKTRSWREPTFNIATGEIEDRDISEVAVEFELYDAQAALVHIGKHHKLFSDQVDVNLRGGLTITPEDRAQAAKELDEWDQQMSGAEPANG